MLRWLTVHTLAGAVIILGVSVVFLVLILCDEEFGETLSLYYLVVVATIMLVNDIGRRLRQ